MEVSSGLEQNRLLDLERLANGVPGGVAGFRLQGGRLLPFFVSDGAAAFSGHSREELEQLLQQDGFTLVCQTDRMRVKQAVQAALDRKGTLEVSFRVQRKAGGQVWVHLNGRVADVPETGRELYLVLTRMSEEETQLKNEKDRMEEYFQTLVKNLTGGVAVVRYEKDGSLVPEYISDGFAAMTGMSLEEAWQLYQQDAMTGVHPEDRRHVAEEMNAHVAAGDSSWELVYRLKQGKNSYIWVKNTLTMIHSEDESSRVYASYHDMTREREEQERLRRQYNDLLMQHYRATDPDILLVGHCNVTKNTILEIIDHTDSGLLENFGQVREEFFTGLSGLVVSPEERQKFLRTFLNEPSLAAFRRHETELTQNCFLRLPKEKHGRYVEFKVTLVETPDTGDVTGILTVTDVTEQTVSDLILHNLSVSSYDLVIDLDLMNERFEVLAGGEELSGAPRGKKLPALWRQILPRDSEYAGRMLEPDYMLRRLHQEGVYSFPYTTTGKNGEILTKNMTVSAADLRLGRVCLARTDITESVREQQGLLRVMASTFELAAFIDVGTGKLKLYTRETILKSLPPLTVDHYDQAVGRAVGVYGAGNEPPEQEEQFRLDTMCKQLAQRPEGYDFVMPFRTGYGLHYKQINVLWGNEKHDTVCMVRADVTDMLAEERRRKKELENALKLAEEASRAKSEFLSSMSHDIRTPMNAIIGMTMLAQAHEGEPQRVAEYLKKISLSSKHLLSLVNDILDMSKIERFKLTLNCRKVSLSELVEQLSAIMTPQAREAGLQMGIDVSGVRHNEVMGDPLRIQQILLNLLSNAIKFTPEGGRVDLRVEELAEEMGEGRAAYRFTVRDTGIGMSKEFLAHLYEPFSRSSGAANVEGTGLGLSITKGLVELMDGRIAVESEPRQGTTFQVRLSFELAQQEEAKDVAAPRDVGNRDSALLVGRRFLIAEDNAINAEILSELLRLHGADSVVKPDGQAVLREFQEKPPGTYAAILMDIQMPKMNGYEAARAIREMKRADAARIPILAMTANAFTEDIQQALEAGMTAHIAKPIDLEVLRATLVKALGEAAAP